MGLLQKRDEGDDEQGELTLSGLDDLDAGRVEDLLFELDEWSDHDRTVLRDRLETLMVPHRWEGTTLVVAPADEAWVERVMDQVDEDLAADEADEDDDEHVAYDLSGWDDDACRHLLDALAAEEIPYAIDHEELVVMAGDERRVDQLVSAVVDPGAAVDEGPAASPDLMGDLFVAADRLVHDPDDNEGTAALLASAERAEAAGPPFGMDVTWWRGIATQARELADRLAADDPEVHDDVVAQATALRAALRPYV